MYITFLLIKKKKIIMELQLLENDRQYWRKIAASILMGSMNGGKIINNMLGSC